MVLASHVVPPLDFEAVDATHLRSVGPAATDAGLVKVEAAQRTRHDAGRHLAGRCAEADAPVWLDPEVTAVEAFPVEVDEPTASRAPASHAPALPLERLMARLSTALCTASNSTPCG
jgi:hypothetical protein